MNYRILSLLAIAYLLQLFACAGNGSGPLQGEWENKRGQVFVFQPGEEMLWIQPTGETKDTFFMRYRFDETKQPAPIDFFSIANGPFKGKKMYGLVELLEDERGQAIRCNIRVGADTTSRPQSMSDGSTTLYVKRK